jgi:drug/metabolite transporter (DMT)-like permease
MVTALVIAVFALKEQVSWQRGAAVVLILGGAVAILVG